MSVLSEAFSKASADMRETMPDDIEVKLGDLIPYGRMTVKRDGKKQSQPIIWKVHDIDGDKAFLIAEQYVGRASYQTDAANVGVLSADPWGPLNELRSWLNGGLRKSIFTKVECARLARNEERDLVSCLSIEEAEKYFASDSERKLDYVWRKRVASLERAKREYEALANEDKAFGKLKAMKRKRNLRNYMGHWRELDGWWLRPTGMVVLNKHIPYVASDGSIRRDGMHAARLLYIRPAIWLITKF